MEYKQIDCFLATKDTKDFIKSQKVYVLESRGLVYRVVFQFKGSGTWVNKLIKKNSDVVGEMTVNDISVKQFNLIHSKLMPSGILVNEKEYE